MTLLISASVFGDKEASWEALVITILDEYFIELLVLIIIQFESIGFDFVVFIILVWQILRTSTGLSPLFRPFRHEGWPWRHVIATMAGESLEHYVAVKVDAAAVGYQAELVLAAEGSRQINDGLC